MEVNHSLLYMWIAVAWMYSLISSGLSDSQILRMAFVAYVERRGDGMDTASRTETSCMVHSFSRISRM